MKLGDFLQILHSYIVTDVDQQDYMLFISNLIIHGPSTKEEKADEEAENYYPYYGHENEKDSCRKIFNGSRPLPEQKARIIRCKFNTTGLEAELSTSNLSGLVDELKNHGITCTEGDAVKVCSKIIELFINAAIPGIPEVDPAVVMEIPESTVPAYDDTELKRLYGVTLLHEVNMHCPNDGCFKPLYMENSEGSSFDYNIVTINPRLDQKSEENMIALCPECARKFNFDKSPETINRLEGLKLELSLLTEIRDKLSSEQIVASVKKVIKKIAAIPVDRVISLNDNPTKVINKMDKTDAALYVKIMTNVSGYYPDVESLFKQEESEGNMDYERFCLQIRPQFKDAYRQGHSQAEIFDSLVDWVAGETNEQIQFCKVVISFFVQKCEVFDEITE